MSISVYILLRGQVTEVGGSAGRHRLEVLKGMNCLYCFTQLLSAIETVSVTVAGKIIQVSLLNPFTPYVAMVTTSFFKSS